MAGVRAVVPDTVGRLPRTGTTFSTERRCGVRGKATPHHGLRGKTMIRARSDWKRSAALVCLAVAVAGTASGADQPAASAPARDAEWSSFRGDAANTGVARSALPEKLRLRWKFDTLAARTAASSPTSAASRPVAEPIESTAAIVGGVVYFGCDDAFVYALDLAAGTERWRFKARGGVRSSPAIRDATVYFGDDEGWMYAVGAGDGKRRWEFQTGGEIISSPKLHDDKLLFGSYDGHLYCLNPADGSLRWKYETEDKLHATVAVVDGHVLIAGCDGKLHVVALRDGASVRSPSVGAPTGASPAVAGSHVFVATQGSQVIAIDWTTGEAAWVFEDGDRQFPFLSSPAVGEKHVVVGGRDRRLRALDRSTGRIEWTYVARRKIDASPVIVGERVFCADDNGELAAVSLKSGEVLWKYESGSAFVASPAVGEGCLVIGSADGVLYCFGE